MMKLRTEFPAILIYNAIFETLITAHANLGLYVK